MWRRNLEKGCLSAFTAESGTDQLKVSIFLTVSSTIDRKSGNPNPILTAPQSRSLAVQEQRKPEEAA
jgi:hypothetical protein